MKQTYAAASRYDIDNRVPVAKSGRDLEQDDPLKEARPAGASGVRIHAARRIGKTEAELARRRGIPYADMTKGETICEFIETFCLIPEGENVGKPFVLDKFQTDFILDVYDNPAVTQRAYLSLARKNGKTALIAAILLAHIIGPCAVMNSQIVSGALSRAQAGLVYDLAAKMIALNPLLTELAFPTPSSKELRGEHLNTHYKALSAEAGTAHGLSPILAILDETGQIKGPKSAFVEAIVTAQGAYANPLLIAISTQASDDSDLFSQWIDDALTSEDPTIVCHLYASEEDADLMDEKAWADANPGLGTIRQVGSLRAAAERAIRMPSEEAGFRQLFMNQRVEAKAPYVARSTWLANGADPDLASDLLWYGGLDLSAHVDLTAFVSVGFNDRADTPSTEQRNVVCQFWCPEDGLHDRSARDRVPYAQWVKEGHLIATPGAAVDYDFVAYQVVEAMKTRRFGKIAFDRWNFPAFSAALTRAGLPQNEIDAVFVPFGQGFASMSPALRALDSFLLGHQMCHGNHPVLALCARNAIVLRDPAGNRKLSRTSADRRIDGMIALTMAVGVAAANQTSDFDVFSMIG
jgi:phage terminase large subunit-like protein